MISGGIEVTSILPEEVQFSDDFRGNRSQLIRIFLLAFSLGSSPNFAANIKRIN